MLRKWERTTKDGSKLARVKRRDYYDLMWYFEQKVRPNMECIAHFKDEKELYNYLLEIIARLDSQSIKYDLESLIEDGELVKGIGDKIKDVLTLLVAERLT